MKKLMLTVVAAASAAVTLTSSGTEYTTREEVKNASWASKVFLWVTAKEASTVDMTWKETYVELWRDWRNPNSGWALGNYRQSPTAVPMYDTSDANYPNIDFKDYHDWAPRLRPFAVEDGEPVKGDGSDHMSSAPNKQIKFVMMVYGSQYGGGTGVMSNFKRGGGNAKPVYDDPIFLSSVDSTTKNATWLNGYKIDPTTTGFKEKSWHILSFQADYTMNSSWYLGHNAASSAIGGGQRYGEILFFTEVPTVAERNEIERYLARTWGLENDCRTSLWQLPNTAYGESEGIQLTNVVAQALSGDTIKLAEGEYDLTGRYMNDTAFTDTSIHSYTHIYSPKTLQFIGDESEHWSDKVVLKGDGRCYAYVSGADGTVFKGITFDGFKSSTSWTVADGGNTADNCIAAAIRGKSGSAGLIVVTNCVFKNCKARSGGAVFATTCYDCWFDKNEAQHHGGAGLNADFFACEFTENKGTGGSAALWWPYACKNCRFLRNYTPASGGAVQLEYDYTITGCYFEANHADASGGAVSTRQKAHILNCVFVDNYCGANGGAIVADDNTAGVSARNGSWGSEIVGCAFTNNYNTSNDGSYRGGAISAHIEYTELRPEDVGGKTVTNKYFHYRGQVSIRDCDFYGNHAKVSAGAVWGGDISNCTFTANYIAGGDYSSVRPMGGAVVHYSAISNCSTVVDSTFVSNRIDNLSNSQGAAIYNYAKASKCENCAFIGNYLDNTNCGSRIYGKIVYSEQGGDNAYRIANCVFTNNAVYCGGIVNNSHVTNTVFYGNDVPRIGACVLDSTVEDSVFINNRKTDRHHPCDNCTSDKKAYGGAIDAISDAAVDAWNSSLTRCTMDGGMYLGCVINNCVITNCTAYGSWCVFRRDNYVTNSLIAGAGGTTMRSFIYRWGSASDYSAKSPWINEFVNCTFADNWYYGQNGTAQRFLACGYPHSTTSRTFKTTLINCAFNNNRSGDAKGLIRDLSAAVGEDSKGADDSVYADVIIAKNCSFGISPVIVSYANVNKQLYTYTDLGGNEVVSAAAQRLVKSDAQAAALGVAKYTPKGGSPVRGKGDASVFAEDAKDLAGNPRVVGGKVDVGCYQSTLPINPALIWVK